MMRRLARFAGADSIEYVDRPDKMGGGGEDYILRRGSEQLTISVRAMRDQGGFMSDAASPDTYEERDKPIIVGTPETACAELVKEGLHIVVMERPELHASLQKFVKDPNGLRYHCGFVWDHYGIDTHRETWRAMREYAMKLKQDPAVHILVLTPEHLRSGKTMDDGLGALPDCSFVECADTIMFVRDTDTFDVKKGRRLRVGIYKYW